MRRLLRLFWLLLIPAALFVAAGTLDWPQGWIFLVEFVAGLFITMGWLKRHDEALFKERTTNSGRKSWALWDRLIGLAISVVWFGWIVLMALDVKRWGLTAMPLGCAIAGAVLIPLGFLFAATALKANTFAATVVRLQDERGQRVVDTGLYAHIRHPMYTGSIIVHLGTALLLGSWIGLPFVLLLAWLLAVRAVLEERLLCRGLPGYADYMARVPWRLVPGVW